MKKLYILIISLVLCISFNYITSYASDVSYLVDSETPFKLDANSSSYINSDGSLYSKGTTSYERTYDINELDMLEYSTSPIGYFGNSIEEKTTYESNFSSNEFLIEGENIVDASLDNDETWYSIKVYGYKNGTDVLTTVTFGTAEMSFNFGEYYLDGLWFSSEEIVISLGEELINTNGYYYESSSNLITNIYDYEVISSADPTFVEISFTPTIYSNYKIDVVDGVDVFGKDEGTPDYFEDYGMISHYRYTIYLTGLTDINSSNTKTISLGASSSSISGGMSWDSLWGLWFVKEEKAIELAEEIVSCNYGIIGFENQTRTKLEKTLSYTIKASYYNTIYSAVGGTIYNDYELYTEEESETKTSILNEKTFISNSFNNNWSTNFDNSIDYSFGGTGLYQHGAVINNKGLLYTSGYNIYGQLGNKENGISSSTSSFSLVEINEAYNYSALRVESGLYNTVVLLDDGNLYGVGLQNYMGYSSSEISLSTFSLLTSSVVDSGKVIDFKFSSNALFVLYENGDLFAARNSTNWSKVASNIIGFDASSDSSYVYAFNTNNEIYRGTTSTFSKVSVTSNSTIVQVRVTSNSWGYLTNTKELFISSSVSSTSLTLTHSDVVYFDMGNSDYAYLSTDNSIRFNNSNDVLYSNNLNVNYYHSNKIESPLLYEYDFNNKTLIESNCNIIFPNHLKIETNIDATYSTIVKIYNNNILVNSWIYSEEEASNLKNYPTDTGYYTILVQYIDSNNIEYGYIQYAYYTISSGNIDMSFNQNFINYFDNCNYTNNLYDSIYNDILSGLNNNFIDITDVYNNDYTQHGINWNISFYYNNDIVNELSLFKEYTIVISFDVDNYNVVPISYDFTLTSEFDIDKNIIGITTSENKYSENIYEIDFNEVYYLNINTSEYSSFIQLIEINGICYNYSDLYSNTVFTNLPKESGIYDIKLSLIYDGVVYSTIINKYEIKNIDLNILCDDVILTYELEIDLNDTIISNVINNISTDNLYKIENDEYILYTLIKNDFKVTFNKDTEELSSISEVGTYTINIKIIIDNYNEFNINFEIYITELSLDSDIIGITILEKKYSDNIYKIDFSEIYYLNINTSKYSNYTQMIEINGVTFNYNDLSTNSDFVSLPKEVGVYNIKLTLIHNDYIYTSITNQYEISKKDFNINFESFNLEYTLEAGIKDKIIFNLINNISVDNLYIIENDEYKLYSLSENDYTITISNDEDKVSDINQKGEYNITITFDIDNYNEMSFVFAVNIIQSNEVNSIVVILSSIFIVVIITSTIIYFSLKNYR